MIENCLTGLSLYKGNVAESIVLAAYIKAGFIVSFPFGGGAPYDFIVDTGKALVKIQVKSGRVKSGRLMFNARRHRGAKNNTFRCYEEGELDVFVVWCPYNQQLYAIPAKDMLGLEGCLRLNEPQNNQKKKIRWAYDYTWDKHIETLRTKN